MIVLLTPPDGHGDQWRIEIRPGGAVTVWLCLGRQIASSPLAWPRTVAGLGEWLVGQGIDPDELRAA
ncbi:hypothetical protein [Polymorphospora lycopeni]|uniref:Uncharacterized protein n=1 Tax=Polymorphospora lycopeni TaxID=3140240 RepID=A0ABV5CLE7_9ACTN